MISPALFVRQVFDELKKVTWPNRQEVARLTFVVIAISVIIGLYIGGLDFIFTKVLQMFVG